MDAKERDHWREILTETMTKVRKDIENFQELSKPVPPDNAIGRLSRMEAINAKSIHEANLRKAESRLSSLRNAMGRLETGDFGICAQCEEPIPQKRLAAVPESTLCLDCLREREEEIH